MEEKNYEIKERKDQAPLPSTFTQIEERMERLSIIVRHLTTEIFASAISF